VLKTLRQKQYLVREKSLKRERFFKVTLSWIIDPDVDYSKGILLPFYQMKQPPFLFVVLQKAAI